MEKNIKNTVTPLIARRTFIFLSILACLIFSNASGQTSCNIVGPTTACANQVVNFSTDCPLGDSNQWTVNNQFVGSGTNLSYIFTSVNSFVVSYSYEAENCAWVWDPDSQSNIRVCETVSGGGDFTIIIYDSPQSPIIQVDKDAICEPSSIALSVTNPQAGVTYAWHSIPAGFSSSGTQVTFNNVSQTTEFVVLASNGTCTGQASKVVSMEQTIAQPLLDARLFYHKRILLPTQNLPVHYWQTSESGSEIRYPASGEFPVTETITEPDQYYIRKYSTEGNCWAAPTGPVPVTLDYTPLLAVVVQAVRTGYNEIIFTHAEKEYLFTYADYYWVNNDSPNPTIIRAFNQVQEVVGQEIYSSGTYYLKGKDRGTGTWGPTLTLNVQLSGDNALNWIHTKAFDGASTEAVVSESKSYFDDAGKPLQSQTKNLSDNFVFATQSLKDKYDRVVGSTLPAPIVSKDFTYYPDFVVNPSGQPYSAEDFDGTVTKYNALPVHDQVPGTLGWYYSANNTWEDFVPSTNYPYSRTEFYEDGTGEVKRSASPGDYHRLGMGHEVLSGTFPVFNELDDYLNRRITALPGIIQDGNLRSEGVQTVARDENGKYVISIADKSGKGVMAARNGSPTDYVLKVDNVLTANASSDYKMVYFYILNSQPITISLTGSPSNGTTIELNEYNPAQTEYIASREIRLLPGFSVTDGNTFSAKIIPEKKWVIENIVTGEKLEPDQTFADANGNWPVGFYRLTMLTGEVTISYTNYYLDVSYQFYDDMGRLKASVSPNGFKKWKENTDPAVNYPLIDKTTYDYNFRGWLLSMTEPDAGTTTYKYRKDGKIRFSQNALQHEHETAGALGKGKFSYTNYDQLGRPVESGQYFGNSVAFSTLGSQLEFSQQTEFTLGDKNDWVKTHYDYADPAMPTLPSEYVVDFVRGAVAYTENANIKTWYSYDELGRVTWMAQKPTKLARVFVSKYTYDFLGNVLLTSTQSYEGGMIREQFYHHYEYDKDKRLVKAFTSTDGTTKKLRASYEYYLHGPLKRIELGGMIVNNNVVSEVQGIDFVYNINGWLTQINHPNKNSDPGGDSNDAFGMVLDYYEPEMDGLFPTAINTKEINQPGSFHGLPNESRVTPYELAFTPKPVFDGSQSWTQNLKMIQDYFSSRKTFATEKQEDQTSGQDFERNQRNIQSEISGSEVMESQPYTQLVAVLKKDSITSE